MGERELRGVLGHELMHVYNRDILTSSVAAGIAGLIGSVAQFLMFFGGGSRRDGEGGGVGIIGSILIALLAPFAATLIQFSLSRTREFDADEDGSKLTGDPLALASALRKLEQVTAHRPMEQTPANQS
ncbi:M48 family metalloprotease, partial [Aerococcus urinae]